MPPDLYERERQAVTKLLTHAPHQGIGGKQHQRMPIGGADQPLDVVCYHMYLPQASLSHWF